MNLFVVAAERIERILQVDPADPAAMTKLAAAVIVLLAVVTASVALSQSFNVRMGATKGPVQPINFSHKIHAGTNQMDCKYCHYGAAQSQWANIPAVSTCMGCHRFVATDKPEIVKLTGYSDRGEQIPWVKVHYLPKYAPNTNPIERVWWRLHEAVTRNHR